MNSEPIQNSAQSSRVAIQLHLAKFQHFKGKGQWKEAMGELNRSLDAILESLENTRKVLRTVNQKFRERNKNPIKKERLSPELVLVEYSDGKCTLLKEPI
jgi:hypothetical protein